MKFNALSKAFFVFYTSPVVVTINNSPASNNGWLWKSLSGVRSFVDNHPYIAYTVIGVTAGVAVYFIGGALIGRSAERSLGDPASTARLIQSNANLRAEMESTRSSMNEVRDALIDVKLELGRINANGLIEIA
jgi:hypothetical protein